MSQFGVGAEWGTRVIAALSVVALTALGTMGCSKSNATFCEDRSDCEPGEVCSDNACEAGNFDAALPAPDASPSCPTASHQCLPSAPAEWSGPTMRAAFEDDSPIPECALTSEQGLVRHAGFEASGTCECTCNTAASVTCTDTRMEAVSGSTISCLGSVCRVECLGQDIVPGVCTEMVAGMLDEDNVRMRAGTVTGGSCNAGTLEPIAPAAAFDETVALCPSTPTDGDCGTDAVCAPLYPEGFSAASCIFREGDHECPADSGYSLKTLAFEDLDDSRSCGACECELPPAGTHCRGSTTSCNIMGVSQTTRCVASSEWNVGATAFLYTPDPDAIDCSPAEENPAISGAVTGIGPVTVCCTAPE